MHQNTATSCEHDHLLHKPLQKVVRSSHILCTSRQARHRRLRRALHAGSAALKSRGKGGSCMRCSSTQVYNAKKSVKLERRRLQLLDLDESDINRIWALLTQASLRRLKVHTAIMILPHHVWNVRGIAMKVNILATNGANETSSRPHANAPAVSIVGTNFIIPLPCLLARYLPEIALWTPAQRLGVATEKLCTNTMS